jgi:cytoskeletal protein RodZ
MRGSSQNKDAPQAMQGNSRTQEFDSRANDRRDGGVSFLSPLFGLIRLAVLGLLLWIGYKFVKKSGWTISRVQATPAPVAAPTATEVPSAEVGEEKPSE